MGFIEDLKKQKVAEEEVRRKAEIVKKSEAEKFDKDRNAMKAREAAIERQRPRDEREYWQRAKDYFEQSGVRGMLNELVKMKAARSVSEDKNNKREDWEPDYVKFKTIFHVELNIGNSFGSSSRDGDLSIAIYTDVDGHIHFKGAGSWDAEFGNHVRRAEWENNRGVLEEALGKAYRNPIEYRTPPRYEPSGDGRNGR